MPLVLLVGLETGVREMEVPDLCPVIKVPVVAPTRLFNPVFDPAQRPLVYRFQRVTDQRDGLPLYEYAGVD